MTTSVVLAPSTFTSGACRAKLGEERSSWIATVRSVGYRFGVAERASMG